jgi:geranylgeranyl pyrophosphate synthase
MNLDSLRHQIEKRLGQQLSKKQPENLYPPMAYLLKAGGKRIRPLLVILSCQAVGGKTNACLNAAVAVELLHTFTLVHDDIMDHDDLRRGIPTVHVQWDEPTAILAGDGLVTLAYQTMLETRHPDLVSILKVFTNGLLTLCEGQAMDKAFEARKHVTLPDYQRMIEKKTATLIEVACEIGAMLGNARQEQKKALKRFARRLGTAFQIQDDLLDVVASQRVLGKPTASDVAERKQTYLTIHFHEHASMHQKKEWLRYYGGNAFSQKDVRAIRSLFKQTGTIESANSIINHLIRQSVSSLEILPDSRARQMLAEFALSIRNRQY